MNIVKDLKVVYCTWFKPHSGTTHQERLESFYQLQADAYDEFRTGLLHGRKPMLAAIAARLIRRKNQEKGNLIWVDMGGGTGYNVELMEEFMDLSNFKEIYIVDLCPSLCEQAKARVSRKGWKNVQVIEGDVCHYQLPEGNLADVISFSYSLSMIPFFHEAIDNAKVMLKPNNDSILAVTDFYTSEKFDLPHRQHNFLTRTFWRSFFELDGIALGPERRQYLDHHFDKEYEFNDMGPIPYLPFLRPPFYVWIGHPKSLESKKNSQREIIKNNTVAGWLFPTTFIYSMSWEDPEEDRQHFKVGKNDIVISLTSGGCNLLDMLLDEPKLIVGVDMNPAQNYLVELKIVGIQHLEYEDFWKMFGEGRHENIEDVFIKHLSPFLSQGARQFWSKRLHYFHDSLYLYGAMGWNVFGMRILSKLGMRSELDQLLNCDTIEEQKKVWETKIRWKLLTVAKLADNRFWLWLFNGVPANQMNMILEETTICDFLCRVFDQVSSNSLLKTENYFYRVCITGRYTKECCPSYLKQDNFNKLKNQNLVQRILLRTETFQNVLLERIYTKVILMDHLDWLTEEPVSEFTQHLSKQVAPGGQIIWRSASTKPWYTKFIEQNGFQVKKISDSSSYMDRVNMYASFYTAYQTSDHSDEGYGFN